MADIAILAAGPNDLAYYIWGGFSTLYAITIPSLIFGNYDSHFGSSWDKTVEDSNVAWFDLYLVPDDVKTNMTAGAWATVVFMAPMALWFLLGLFWEGAFSTGMSIIGTISWIGMVFFVWGGSYVDDGRLNVTYAETMWYVDDKDMDDLKDSVEDDPFGGLGVFTDYVLLGSIPTRLDEYGVYEALPAYQLSLIIKTVLNLSGWVAVAMFYDDFQAHVTYMENFAIATEDELLEAEMMNCDAENDLVTEERCKEIKSEKKKSEKKKSKKSEKDDEDEDAEDVDEEDLDDFEADEEEESI